MCQCAKPPFSQTNSAHLLTFDPVFASAHHSASSRLFAVSLRQSPMAAAAVPNGHTAAAGEETPPAQASSSSLVFLGTGCSSAVPNARCLIQPSDPPCPVCSQSLSVPPELNPNYRCCLESSPALPLAKRHAVSDCWGAPVPSRGPRRDVVLRFPRGRRGSGTSV
jgi:hypothetical protein